ncbi:MAG TPA: hypothetical protein VGJ57_12340 [Nitrospirales bacterium]
MRLTHVVCTRRFVARTVMVVLAATLIAELAFRYVRIAQIVEAQSMYRSVGYTGGLVFSFADLLFDDQGRTPPHIEALRAPHSIESGSAEQLQAYPNSIPSPGAHGLFLTNRDGFFWWFERNGAIKQESRFHLNNLGLISVNDFKVKRAHPTFRIVVLGDELTAATTANKSWPDHLQDILNRDPELHKIGPIEVINFGWPDADFDTFSRVWIDKARGLKPDLLIVNIAEHLFDRMPNPDARIPSGPQYKTFWEPFAAPNGLRAWLIVTCYGEGRRLRDPDCNTGRPFGLWLPKALAHDAQALSKVQDQIVFDYVGQLVWHDWRLTWPLALAGRLSDPLQVRTFNSTATVSVIPPLKPEVRVENASRHLAAILDDFPATLMIVNRNYTELTPKPADLPMVKALQRSNPRFRIEDMAGYLPTQGGGLEAWYQVGLAQEKWSDKGHEVNARAVAALVIRRLRDDGFLPMAGE